MEGAERTGVTLQTMHPLHFDQGVILDRTPFPGLVHGCDNVAQLTAKMAPLGAEMLVQAIRHKIYIPPLKQKDCDAGDRVRPIRFAPKITSEDGHIDWHTWTAARIRRTYSVLGRLWNFAAPATGTLSRERRVQWSDGFNEIDQSDMGNLPGVPYLEASSRSILIRTCDDRVLMCGKVKFDGERTLDAGSAMKKFTGTKHLDTPSSSEQRIVPIGISLS